MSISITTHHVSITDPIKEYVEKKLKKLDKFSEVIQKIEIDLDVEPNKDQFDRQIITTTIWVTGTTFRAKESHKDMYAAIDLQIEKLERQLRRFKEKSTKKNRKSSREEFLAEMTGAKEKEKSSKPTKHKKYFIPKPMHIEDAANALESEGLSFLVFRNAEHEEINVIYVDDDGKLALIDP